jgi:nucleoside diphosphate kinase
MKSRTLVFFKSNITMNGEAEKAYDNFFHRFTLFKEFYNHVSEPDLTRHSTFCSSGLIFIMILEGEDVIERVRQLIGCAESSRASFNTLRGYFYQKYKPENGYDNFIHASESKHAFVREMMLFSVHLSVSAQTINGVL